MQLHPLGEKKYYNYAFQVGVLLFKQGGKIFLFFLSSRVERSFENDRGQEKEEEEEKEIRGSVTRATLAGSIL